MASLSLSSARQRARRRYFRPGDLAHWTVLGVVLVLVLYPIVLLMLNSFQNARPGEATTFTLDAWRIALSDDRVLSSVWNTIAVVFVRQGISMPVAIFLAWLLARTDIPGGKWLEFLFWLGFFLPSLPITLGWILLLDPFYGLINKWVVLLPFIETSPFDIYSFWGIIWVHLGTATLSIKVMLLTPAFRNMDASLEEASRVSGASTLGTLIRVVVPVMTPILLVVLLLSIVHSLQSFEVELILGKPIGFYVFATQIYNWIYQQEIPQFPVATALSGIVLGLMLPLIVMQRLAVGRRRYTTVTGQFKSQVIHLRQWRMPAFYLVLGVALLTSVVPLIFLVLATFMRLFGFFDLPETWTTSQWSRVLDDPVFLNSVKNTILLSIGSALVAVAFFTIVAYILVRTQFVGRAILDITSWLPASVPGMILGLGLLWLVFGNPLLRPLYGTLVVLIIVTVISSMPTGIQVIKSNFVQLGQDLEEAGRVVGGSWWYAFRRILLPIITPTLLMVGALSFIAAARTVSTVALLATRETRPLSLLQMDYMVEGRYEVGAVIGVVVVALTTGAALIARGLGLRIGLR